MRIGNAQKKLNEKRTTLWGATIDETYVRRFFADAT
jgi:hypothetical protein